MRAIELATQHYADLGRKQIVVPEWGEDGAPLTIYWTPLTAREHRKIVSGEDGRTAAMLVKVLILKAEDLDGRKIFDEKDRPALMERVDVRVVTRVANAIFNERSIEDLEGNS